MQMSCNEALARLNGREVFDVVFIIFSCESLLNSSFWFNSIPLLTLVPTLSVIVSPTFNAILPLVFKWVGITISSSFSGNLPSLNFTERFSNDALVKAFIKA